MDESERDDEAKSKVRQRAAWSKPRLQAMLPADRTHGGVWPYPIESPFYRVS